MGTGQPSRRLTSLIESLRVDFTAIASALTSLSVRRAHFAPVFMRAFRAWERETGRPFVAFVQQLDPTVPAEKSEYVQHRSFQAACYLRRIDEAPETRAGSRKGTMTPLAVLACVLRSSVAPEHVDFAISQVRHVSKWHDRDVKRLRDRVAKARVIALEPNKPRLVRERRMAAAHLRVAHAADRSVAS